MELLELGDTNGAIEHSSLSLEKEKRPKTLFERAKIHFRNGNIEGAISDTEQEIDLCDSPEESIELLNKLHIFHSQVKQLSKQDRMSKPLKLDIAGSQDFDSLLEQFVLVAFREYS